MDQAREPPILSLFDALIARDRGAPGFTGEICVVVRGTRGDTYWRATFTEKARAGFVRAVPSTASALLVLGESEADALLRAQPPPRMGLFQIAGDKDLFLKFVNRYCSVQSGLDVRISEGLRVPTRKVRTSQGETP